MMSRWRPPPLRRPGPLVPPATMNVDCWIAQDCIPMAVQQVKRHMRERRPRRVHHTLPVAHEIIYCQLHPREDFKHIIITIRQGMSSESADS